tara:strand:+ start:2385 stop:3122 length:738 start_codon:yes stop_codon:yes gene_type:complete
MSHLNIKRKILIFIPAYNVEKKIYSVINRIPKDIFLKNEIDILIINDFSNDDTLSEINKCIKDFEYKISVYSTEKNLGYGGVQKYAFNYAIKHNYDHLIMLHGDGQYAPEELPNFINTFNENYDAVFGSRMKSYLSALKGGMPLYKFLGNIGLTFVQNIILGSKISEFHSGYRTFKVNSLKKIEFEDKADYYHFDTEIIIEFLKKGLKILEIHIPTYYGDEISHLKSIPYGFKVLITTLKSRFKK